MIDPTTIPDYLEHQREFNALSTDQQREHLGTAHDVTHVFTPSFWTNSAGEARSEPMGHHNYHLADADPALFDYEHWEDHGGPAMDYGVVYNHQESKEMNNEWEQLLPCPQEAKR